MAIAAWAASQNQSIAPTIATGQLSNHEDGRVENVGGMKGKIQAINALAAALPRDDASRLALLPAAWQTAHGDFANVETFKKRIHVVWVESLQQIFNMQGLLIDGFAPYRQVCENLKAGDRNGDEDTADFIGQSFDGRARALRLPHQDARAESSWHLYVVRLRLEAIGTSHREVFEAMRGAGIGDVARLAADRSRCIAALAFMP